MTWGHIAAREKDQCPWTFPLDSLSHSDQKLSIRILPANSNTSDVNMELLRACTWKAAKLQQDELQMHLSLVRSRRMVSSNSQNAYGQSAMFTSHSTRCTCSPAAGAYEELEEAANELLWQVRPQAVRLLPH